VTVYVDDSSIASQEGRRRAQRPDLLAGTETYGRAPGTPAATARNSPAGSGPEAAANASGSRSDPQYARHRARDIAYGRWDPWADAAPVREHVQLLRETGASYRTIAKAAGVSTTTVCRLLHGERSKGRAAPERVRARQARRLLAVTASGLERAAVRRDASGARRRLQALVAMGRPIADLSRCLDVAPRKVWHIIGGRTATVTPGMHASVRGLYERMWDLRPPERTAAERKATAAARALAAKQGWPTPMGLDDDRIDDPAYRPRTRWRQATGAGVTPPPDRDNIPRPGRRLENGDDAEMEAAS
jgi:Bacterial regulatory proteins, lacI family